MARFDLYKTRSQRIPYLLEVQSDTLETLASRVVIPVVSLEQAGAARLPRLNPGIMIDGVPHILMPQEMTTIPASKLRRPVGNIAEHRDAITAAMDFLFQGF